MRLQEQGFYAKLEAFEHFAAGIANYQRAKVCANAPSRPYQSADALRTPFSVHSEALSCERVSFPLIAH